jgi:hypothetical protein
MLPQTRLERLPRMADFALWAAACETAFWPAGTFWTAYCGNRDEAVEDVIEADPVATAVRAMMQERQAWSGTATDLLNSLAPLGGERNAAKKWPSNPRALSGRLRRAATFLRKVGIAITFDREAGGRVRNRIVRITAAHSSVPENVGMRPSEQSASGQQRRSSRDFAEAQVRTVAADADGRADDPDTEEASIVRSKPLKTKVEAGADGADANLRPQSGPEKFGENAWRTRL